MKKGSKFRKLKRKAKNIVLYAITYIMGAVAIAQMVIYAFGKPSWVQALLFTIACAWCWTFACVNTRGE